MKRSKNKTLYYVIGVVIVLILISLGMMLIMNSKNNSENLSNIDSENSEIKIEQGMVDPLAEEIAEDEKLAKKGKMKVSSLYCDIYYPIEWKEKVIVKDELNVVTFIADYGNDKKVDLFEVVAVEDEGGNVEMHIVKFNLVFDDKWSTQEKKEVEQMQEDADFVAKYLKKDKFTVIME